MLYAFFVPTGEFPQTLEERFLVFVIPEVNGIYIYTSIILFLNYKYKLLFLFLYKPQK